MAATREQAMTALLALLSAVTGFATVSRRNPRPEQIGMMQSPALFLLEDSEIYERPAPQMPPKRILKVSAVLYNDVGQDENAIPSTAINNALDAIDAALDAARRADPFGRATLGQLVYAVNVDGEVKKAPGDKTGKSLAVLPLAVILP